MVVSCCLIQLAEIRRASQDDQLIAVFHDGIWGWIELHAAAGPLSGAAAESFDSLSELLRRR